MCITSGHPKKRTQQGPHQQVSRTGNPTVPAAMQLMEDINARKAQESAAQAAVEEGPEATKRTLTAEEVVTQAAERLSAPPLPKDKAHLPSFGQLDAECVRAQFSAAAMFGIRSLPHALNPDFRMQLYGALVLLGKQRHRILREHQAQLLSRGQEAGAASMHDVELATATALLLAHSPKGGPMQEPVRSDGCPDCRFRRSEARFTEI